MAAQFMFIQCEFSSHFHVYHPGSLFHIICNIEMSMKMAWKMALSVESLLYKHEVLSWMPMMHVKKSFLELRTSDPGDGKVKREGSLEIAGQPI